MTLPATASLIGVDAVQAAAGAVTAHLVALGDATVRTVVAGDLPTDVLGGGVTLAVPTAGVAGRILLVAGVDATEALTSGGDSEKRLASVMDGVVAAVAEQCGDLGPGTLVVDPTPVSGAAVDVTGVWAGLFIDDELIGLVGFVPEPPPAPEEPAGQAPAGQVFGALVSDGTGFGESRRMQLLRDVEMGVSVELGRTRMTVRELLGLTPGMIVELDRAAGAPVDVLVNGTLMARGEVVVIDEEFAVRISEIVNPETERGSGS